MSRLIPIVVLVALVALLLGGCGGDSTTTVSEAPGDASTAESGDRAYVAAADHVCAGMIAESRRMGTRFTNQPAGQGDALTLTTRELVEPALPILERSAGRLRALEGRANSLALKSYVALYDPIIAVVRDRVEAGEAGDATRAHALELQMLDLSEIQRQVAHEAGLKTCDVDFIHTFATSGHAR
jgi:hypothetical protein